VILVAGGTGVLGTHLVRLLTNAALPVRVLTRDPQRAGHLVGTGAQIVEGDVRNRAEVRRATTGATAVVSAIQGFGGADAGGVRAVDGTGNGILISEAVTAGAEHFVLVSAHGASASHPIELFRMKYRAEQELMTSPLDWTIVRPTAFMETWMTMLAGGPTGTGQVRVFGKGENPINFVSARDVARVVALAVTDEGLRRQAVDIAGPQNLTFNQFAHTLLTAGGRPGPVRHVPRPAMRVLALLLRPVRPILADQIAAGVVMDTATLAYDTDAASRRWAHLPRTALADLAAPGLLA
jgi:uncharacterized protein YbjT (DUF2867 family)